MTAPIAIPRIASFATPIRYMGSKRDIAERVRAAVRELAPEGPAVDLFSGMGCVAESLADTTSVVTNDSLAFTGALARARFTAAERPRSAAGVITAMQQSYREHLSHLSAIHRDRLRVETAASDGTTKALANYFASSAHVANSSDVAAEAAAAEASTGSGRYCLATLYFSCGYFSLRQSIEIDAIRFAIDELGSPPGERDWLVAAWLCSLGSAVNAPGHTAQYLKPNNEVVAQRIRRAWRRDIWEDFKNRLTSLKPVGTVEWRRGNRVEVSDALDLLASARINDAGVIYADPPYTRDQYSRYYHVYETLYRYDFPTSKGVGRTPEPRSVSAFSLKSKVVAALGQLRDAIADLGVPLILSYPSSGLAATKETTVHDLLAQRFAVTTESFTAQHSTLGASKGSSRKQVTENIYVCRP